jgi:Cdc6-like AAA superfamily ATPase
VDLLHERQDNRERHEEHRAILDWLTLIDYATQQNDFISRRQEGTGQWLLDSDEFQRWLNQSGQTLFCSGIPGAGKTIITSIVVKHLWEIGATTGVAYLYCDFRHQHEQKPEDLLASLLKQLVRQQASTPESVKSIYDRHQDKPTRPSFDEILKALHSVVAYYSRTFIIIDALDECQVSCDVLLSAMFALQAQTQINLFATSRPVPEITSYFEGCCHRSASRAWHVI